MSCLSAEVYPAVSSNAAFFAMYLEEIVSCSLKNAWELSALCALMLFPSHYIYYFHYYFLTVQETLQVFCNAKICRHQPYKTNRKCSSSVQLGDVLILVTCEVEACCFPDSVGFCFGPDFRNMLARVRLCALTERLSRARDAIVSQVVTDTTCLW